MTSRPHFTALALLALVALAAAAPALADPTLGFTEEFPGSSFGNWQSPWPLGNPATGGVGGDGDGFLRIAADAGFLGVKTGASDYVGNYLVAGVSQIRLWVKDVGGNGGMQLHLAIGNQGNFWQYDPGVDAEAGRWKLYVVDLTNEASFTHIIGSGTFSNALSSVDRILLRHDVAPFEQFPEAITGTLGLDHILLTNGTVGVEPGARVVGDVRLGAPYPNPARGAVSFALESPAGDALTLRVLDLAGREIRRAAWESGGRAWTWDGRDAAGRRVAPGVYVVQAIGSAGRSERRVALLR